MSEGVVNIQEEIDNRTIALAVSASKMTGRLLQSMIREYRNHRKNTVNKNRTNTTQKVYNGKQSIKKLVESGAQISNIEITDKNIKSFEHSAKKYGVDFALKKDSSKDPPTYIVFFKAKDLDMINLAFNDYSERKLRDKPSIRKALSKMKELAKNINPKDRARRKEQERDR